MEHPAKYSRAILEKLEEILYPIEGTVLDPFGGVGGIHKLRRPGLYTVATEIEYEWAAENKSTIVADATQLPFPNNTFDAICTSPVYGNRMSDHHEAKDNSKRHTYRHTLGRPLTNNNAGQLQWGEKYRNLHQQAWEETNRVAKNNPNTIWILNISNHIRKGQEIDVTQWHHQTITNLGWTLHQQHTIQTPRQRNGQNANLRTPHEYINTYKRT